MITIADYGRGNLFSLCQALSHLGAEYDVTDEPERIASAKRLILPGVGAFGDAMSSLRRNGLVEPLREAVAAGTPLLGICLGMQLLVDGSEEFGKHEGLGLIPGMVRSLPEGESDRIPNVGWRVLHAVPGHFLDDLEPGTMVYFVHSYAPAMENQDHVASTITFNGREVVVVLQHDNVIGYQFHPEKSGPAGLDLLRRFLELS